MPKQLGFVQIAVQQTFMTLNVNNVHASSIASTPKTGNLNNYHYQLILSPTGWLNDDIILEAHLNLKKIDPTMQGLQDPALGPVRQFKS